MEHKAIFKLRKRQANYFRYLANYDRHYQEQDILYLQSTESLASDWPPVVITE